MLSLRSLIFPLLGAVPLLAVSATDKREPHLRLRSASAVAQLSVSPYSFNGSNPDNQEPITDYVGRKTSPLARYFLPGPLGYEPGTTPPAPGPRAYQTRAYSGLDSAEARAWGSTNGLGRIPWFSHNLYNIFTPEVYFQHPEYFPLVDGVRKFPTPNRGDWNPDIARLDVAEHAAKAAIDFFAANPHAESFALGTNDGVIFGESPELLALVAPGAPAVAAMPPQSPLGGGGASLTRSAVGADTPSGEAATGLVQQGTAQSSALHRGTSASSIPTRWFRGRPDYSNLVFTFTNRVAERVAMRYPDKYIGALAYYWSENAPDFPVHPNVMPFLTADRSQGYDPAFRAGEAALQARWARGLGAAPAGLSVKGYSLMGSDPNNQEQVTNNSRGAVPPRLGLYDYVYGHGFLIPRLHTALLAQNLRDARRLGFTEYFAEVNPNWGLDGPQPWLVAQLLLEPEANPEALLDEYYARYFREAARPMRRFFETCEEIWMKQPGASYWLKHYRNESQAALFPPEICARLRRLLDDAARRASTPGVARRVAFVSEAFGLTERFSALHATRTAVTAWSLLSAARPADGRRLLAAYTKARAEFIAYAAALREREPLAIHPFRLDDYLQSDPTWMAVSRLVELGAPPEIGAETHSVVAAAVRVLSAKDRVPVEIVRDGGFEGPRVPARRIADLPYGLDATVAWASANEPREEMRFALDARAARSGTRSIRISDALGASLFQWHPTSAGKAHVASVRVRGRLAASSYATLTLTWTDDKQRTIGSRTVARLPEGEWPEWVELVIGGEAPVGAAFVVVAVTAQYQTDGAWVEFDDVSLKEY